ncbi:MAG: thiamine phosphate synthase [Gemmatimonadota bacterium]
MDADALGGRLRLIVITDDRLAAPRSVEAVVRAALEAGAGAIQLRDKRADARTLLARARVLREMTLGVGALLFVNDRLDVALAADADGVHVGPDDLPVRSVRRVVPDGFLVGYSADEPDAARRARDDGADYVGCGAVYGTTTKDVGDEAIGLAALDRVARAVDIPVVAIGGVTPERADEVARTAATGVAVIGAVMGAADPAAAVGRLLRPFRNR